MTTPITVAWALFSNDVVRVLLGSKWTASAEILRLLAPIILIFGIISPVGWLMTSLGLVMRNLKPALIFAPLITAGYAIGLPYGPSGVALGLSGVMTLCLIPQVAFCVRDTPVSLSDILQSSNPRLASAMVAGVVAFIVRVGYGHLLSPSPRLALEMSALGTIFFGLLLFVAGQKSLYLNLLRALKGTSSIDENTLASA